MAELVRERTNTGPRRALWKGLHAYNDSRVGRRRHKALTFTLRHEGEIVGGVAGEVWADWLFVLLLWIDEAHRGGDHGTALMDALETEARRFGAARAYVDTFSFQARPFYEKRGYRLFGELDDFPTGHSRFWLTKAL